MTKSQREFNAAIDKLLELCRLRGIGSHDLRRPLYEIYTKNLHKGTQWFQSQLDRLDELAAAGVSAQLSHLLKVWGIRRLKKFLEGTGGVLDAIVRHTNLSPGVLEADTGRNNIDADGFVIRPTSGKKEP